jgi:hypothetical protein
MLLFNFQNSLLLNKLIITKTKVFLPRAYVNCLCPLVYLLQKILTYLPFQYFDYCEGYSRTRSAH